MIDSQGRHVADVLGEDALKAIQPHVDKALGGEQVCYEAKVDYLFGEGQFVEVNYAPQRDAGGEIPGFAALVRNVTAGKRVEEALLAQRDLLATQVNSFPDVVCLKDGDGHWLLANNAAMGLFGLDPQDYQGKSDRDLLNPEQSVFFHDALDDEAAWRSGSLVQTEVQYAPAGGAVRYFNVVKLPCSTMTASAVT